MHKSLLFLTLQAFLTLFLILVLAPSQASVQGASQLLEKLEAYRPLSRSGWWTRPIWTKWDSSKVSITL